MTQNLDPDIKEERRNAARRVLTRGRSLGVREKSDLLHELAAAALLAVFAACVGAAVAWTLPYLPLCFGGGGRPGLGGSNPLRDAAKEYALAETTAAMKARTLIGAAVAGGVTLLSLVAAVLVRARRNPPG